MLLDSSSVTAPFLLHKLTRSKGPFPQPALPGLIGRMALSDSQTGRRPFWRRSETRLSSQSRASPTDPDRLSHMPCSLPRRTGSGARWLRVCAFQRRFLPCPCCLPRISGGSASASSLSRPARASHAFRPVRLLTPLSWALSRGSARAGFPARTLASHQVQPTTSLGGSFPPLVICAFGAH